MWAKPAGAERSARAKAARGPETTSAEVVARLRRRAPEIREVIFAAIHALAGPEREDDEYLAGLRATAEAAIVYSLAELDGAGGGEEPIPSTAICQVRYAARLGVPLEAVLRRYAAGDRLFGAFVVEEAAGMPPAAVRQLLRKRGAAVDRLMAAISSEYDLELSRLRRSPRERLAEQVQLLLAGGSPEECPAIVYEFGSWHLGLVAAGEQAERALHSLAAKLSCRVLVVPRHDVVWGWLGTSAPLSSSRVEVLVVDLPYADISLSIGEPRAHLEGWRMTHHEALAAMQVMRRQPQRLVRCGRVILLAAMLRDEELARSLIQTYLAPLDGKGDTGDVLRQTLRAYFAAGYNAATAAAALRVNRHTIHRRLRRIEERLGCLIDDCHAELQVALRLEELGVPAEVQIST